MPSVLAPLPGGTSLASADPGSASVAEIASRAPSTPGAQDVGPVSSAAEGSAVIPLEPASQASLASDHATYLVQGDSRSYWLTFRHDGPATWQVSFVDESGRTFGTLTIDPSSELMTVDVVDGSNSGQPFLLSVDRLDGTAESDRLTVISDEVAPAPTDRLDLASAQDSGLMSMLPDEFYEQLFSADWVRKPAPVAHGAGIPADLSVHGESTGSATDFSLPSMPDRIGGWSPIAPTESLVEEQGGEEGATGETPEREALAELGSVDLLANVLATVDLKRGLIDAPGGICPPTAVPPGLPGDGGPVERTVTEDTSGPDAPAYRQPERMARGGAGAQEETSRAGVALSVAATLVIPNLAVLTWSGRRRRSRRRIRDLECENVAPRPQD